MKAINFRVVLILLGILLILEGLFIFISTLESCGHYINNLSSNTYTTWSGISSVILLIIGVILFGFNWKVNDHVTKLEGYLIVYVGWIFFESFRALPFYLNGWIPSYTNALLETMSGFTTTRLSIINNLNIFPHEFLWGRSLTQWLCGIGIMVFMLALVHLIETKRGKQLFAAEGTGIQSDSLTPRIAGTVKRICLIYSLMTLLETVLLRIRGMSWVDSSCHSFGSISTVVYSSNQDSLGYWESHHFVQYVIILFTFLAGVTFTLYYFSLFRRQVKRLCGDTEFRNYLFISIFFSILVGLYLYFVVYNQEQGFEKTIRDVTFQVIKVFSTTVFFLSDYMSWSLFVISVLWMLMFIGAYSGSTGGGMKVVRVTILVKNCYYELNRMIHPNAIIPIKYNKKILSDSIVPSVLSFTMLYSATFLVSTLVLTVVSFYSALWAIPSCLAKVGPGLNKTGSAHTFYLLSESAKWYLSFLMLLGRLELVTLRVIFSPKFSKNRYII